jgi:adenylate kinase
MPLNLFIIGPSGCGKSTQAKLVAEKYNLTHLSMGQLLRDEIAAGSGFGDEAKSYLDNGKLVPDDLIFDILIAKLNSINNQNFIIDGFPRVLNQGKFMEYYLKKKNLPFSLLIHLSVTFEEISARRAKLGKEFQDQSRTDNTPEAIISRQQFYNDSITPIREYFESKGLFVDIDGNRPIEPIFSDICQKINKLLIKSK